MSPILRRSTAIGLPAIALALGWAHVAQADLLPVTNLQFNVLTNPFDPANSQKDFFTSVAPVGWSIGAAAQNDNLIYVGQQGSEGFQGGSGNVYPVYTNPGFSVTVPAGTNFFQADGNPEYESTIFQTISGLTANTTYTLQFQQAAGQQQLFSGDTQEQWKVFLGNGGIGVSCPADPPGGLCSVTGADGDIEVDSPLMNTASQHNTDWNNVNMSFTPSAAELTAGGSAILTFLAWGDSGNTTNLPPTVFLEGVNTPPVLPEPASLTLLGVGLAGLGLAVRRRRAKRTAAE